MNPFVRAPVDGEAERERNTATVTETRCLVWSVLFPCLFYKLTLEGAIVTDSLQSAHSEDTGRVQNNTKLGGRTETDTTSGGGSKLYIFKCKNQTDKIFVNIKFLVCFSFILFF